MTATCLVFGIGIASLGNGLEAAHVENRPPARDEFLIIPLRIHILQSRDVEMADCKLRDADVTRIVGKLNAIWSPAGIHFGIESIIREPARPTGPIPSPGRAQRGSTGTPGLPVALAEAEPGVRRPQRPLLPRAAVQWGLPRWRQRHPPGEGRAQSGRGGNGRAGHERVLGHTLGAALGLRPKREPRTSLLALGTTGAALDAAESEHRRVAKTIPGAMTVAEMSRSADAAQAAGQSERAKRLRAWLAEISNDTKVQKGTGRGPDAPPPTPRSCS